MTRKDPREREPNWTGWAIWVGIGTILLVLVFAGALIYITRPIDEWSVAKAGVFGDSFGPLNALFSGLAFAGLVIALLMQRYDLKLQREEINETRQEVRKQNFENTFFQMLRLHNEIVTAMRIDYDESWYAEDGPESKTTPVSGRDCFLELTRRFKSQYNRASDGNDPTALATIQRAYNDFWTTSQQSLGHYFRYLYRIFRFIDQGDSEDKLLYSGIVRAQLSDLELLLLYYNGLSRFGIERFKPLAERYALYDNLPIQLVIHDAHLSLYDIGAWGAQAEAVQRRLDRFLARKAALAHKSDP